MIGMEVCVQHIANLHPSFFSKTQIYVSVLQQVAHGGLGLTAQPKKYDAAMTGLEWSS